MRTYLSGDDAPNRELANYLLGHTGGVGDISQVGSYPLGASPYGTMDMAGNVFEWVLGASETYREMRRIETNAAKEAAAVLERLDQPEVEN